MARVIVPTSTCPRCPRLRLDRNPWLPKLQAGVLAEIAPTTVMGAMKPKSNIRAVFISCGTPRGRRAIDVQVPPSRTDQARSMSISDSSPVKLRARAWSHSLSHCSSDE